MLIPFIIIPDSKILALNWGIESQEGIMYALKDQQHYQQQRQQIILNGPYLLSA